MTRYESAQYFGVVGFYDICDFSKAVIFVADLQNDDATRIIDGIGAWKKIDQFRNGDTAHVFFLVVKNGDDRQL